MLFESSISPEAVQALPELKFEGDIIVVDTLQQLKKLVPELILENTWGFDTETKPNFLKGNPNPNTVSLLQLSGAGKTYLFRLKKIGLPDIIKHILSSPKIVKAGVAVRDDINALKKIKTFSPEGFTELQTEAHKFGITDISLRNLAAIVLGMRISKAQQLSNWENEQLSEKQIYYAAIDAWVCRQIFLKFQASIHDRENS
ncbi:MAG: 3'-5' exonuclease domain-containing protein 2 [Bacteroidales bacterium]|nr:3'-5' exonuclease domain-containing protein 2 [Bacteroidales bacterium]HOY39004.1 3'-5' exonuclease [Bacteroidales bacterium]HQP03475.1 3'-5' exonuclease [Bacteroidales bacterium]